MRGWKIGTVAMAAMLVVAACGSDDDSGASDSLKTDVIEHYADGVEASYALSLSQAEVMAEDIDAFLAAPTDASLEVPRASRGSRRVPHTAAPKHSGSTAVRSTTKRTAPKARSTRGRSTRSTSTTSWATPTPASSTTPPCIPRSPSRSSPTRTKRAARPTSRPVGTRSSSCCGVRTSATTVPATVRHRLHDRTQRRPARRRT